MEAPDGIPGSVLTGPYPVGTYAAALRDRLRGFTRVQVFGEVFGFKAGRAKVWFELRDAGGALPCSMWREDFEKLRLGTLQDGAQVVVAGGCDYYPGSRTASPGFSFAVTRLRVAGEGDLLAQLEQLRRRLHAEGLFEPQKALTLPKLPRCIGVVTGESGKARDDVLAGLRRRGWAGRLVWGFAPVQDRHAAPAIARAVQDLAACEEVEVIVVARGGGSLADLFAFCDETLCRTVALLRVPVISSVGHHTDRTLLDDVAAVACSTPTHAAETAVPVDCTAARVALVNATRRLERQGRRAVLERARTLARLSRAPGHHIARHRTRLHQQVRELRAATRRAVTTGERQTLSRAATLERKATAASVASERAGRRALGDGVALERASGVALERRRRELDRVLATLAAHDPQRTLERGYALVEGADGEPVTSAEAARAAATLTVRMHDGRVTVVPSSGETLF
ncbi:exodeoxyribonuclease VII large subunit [Solirubrobacter ginsenosidimutans]|uniref:Exodeoxyribonuclease 7 large subunit n=1 Tax=Solirubrobacter ginsenosidimutans TaxID=490573 RepID=A0A9X3MWE2_9ACTN|nr:exodeoxyribonuclease VII large subunit [Solirubrobacter ginsenosidimutans]MDA0163885.1 exodeoxyribonuclease VII large subunit [Solirubrobacter ginsenosidimutans]